MEIFGSGKDYRLFSPTHFSNYPKFFKQLLIGLTSFYGNPNSSKREKSSRLLETLQPCSRTPWVIIGHFNEILYQHEMERGKPRSERVMSNFCQALEHCQVSTLVQQGDIYTWSKELEDKSFMKERLDRALINKCLKSHYT